VVDLILFFGFLLLIIVVVGSLSLLNNSKVLLLEGLSAVLLKLMGSLLKLSATVLIGCWCRSEGQREMPHGARLLIPECQPLPSLRILHGFSGTTPCNVQNTLTLIMLMIRYQGGCRFLRSKCLVPFE
jgi:hypothetical protein